MFNNQQQPQQPIDIRAYIQQLQESGALENLSTSELESLLTQLKGSQVKGYALPKGQGVSFQGEDGRQIALNPEPSAQTSGEEMQSIAEILKAMKGR